MNLFISQSVFNHQISFTEEKLSVETETSLFIYFFFAMLLGCGILVPQPGIEPKSMAVKVRVLTTGPPGNSQKYLMLLRIIV